MLVEGPCFVPEYFTFLSSFLRRRFCARRRTFPAGGRGGGRGGRGNTRDFLGLGPPPDAAAAARGEKLYAPNCAFCHGEKARGAEGPNLVPLCDRAARREGRNDWPRDPQRLSRKRHAAVSQLRAKASCTTSRSSCIYRWNWWPIAGLYKRLNVVTGDAKAGEAYFNGAGGCKGCHSVTGDLAHVGTNTSPRLCSRDSCGPAAEDSAQAAGERRRRSPSRCHRDSACRAR